MVKMKSVDEVFTDLPWWADYDEFEDCWKVYCTRKGFPDCAVTLDGNYDEKTAKAIASLPKLYKVAVEACEMRCVKMCQGHIRKGKCDNPDCQSYEWREAISNADGEQ